MDLCELIAHTNLYREAQYGNIEYLRTMCRRAGYIRYDSCIAQVALYCQHVAFWDEFVCLSLGHLPRDRYPWDARILVFTDLMIGFRGTERDLYDLFCPLYETLLIWRGPGPELPDPEQEMCRELEADLCLALVLHPLRLSIVHYLVKTMGFRFKTPHLELAQLTFDRGLIRYVRKHLDPDCVTDDTDLEPNNCDLFMILVDAIRLQYFRCDYGAVVQFLIDYPDMIEMMYSMIDFLQELRDRMPSSFAPPTTDGDFPEKSATDNPPKLVHDHPELYHEPLASRHYPVVAAHLLEGVVGSGPEPAVTPAELPLVVVKPPSKVVGQSWVETYLLQTQSNPRTLIDDVIFMSRLTLLMVDEVDPGLQAWNLVDRDDGPSRNQFQFNCAPNRIWFIARKSVPLSTPLLLLSVDVQAASTCSWNCAANSSNPMTNPGERSDPAGAGSVLVGAGDNVLIDVLATAHHGRVPGRFRATQQLWVPRRGAVQDRVSGTQSIDQYWSYQQADD